MAPTKFLQLHYIVLVIMMLLFAGACSSGAAATGQVPMPTPLPVIVVTATPLPFGKQVSPVPTPTAYSASGAMLMVDLKTNYQARLRLGMNQKLQIIPPEEWGYYGWDVTFDQQFLQLDPQIDAKHPPLTGWIWTPRQTGQTRIGIISIEPCRNYYPPCSVPEFGGFIDVTIVRP